MAIKDRQKFGKQCLLIAAAITVLSIFFMFGRAAHWDNTAASSLKNNPSLFELAFGLNTFTRKAGFTAIFVFEVIAIVLSVISILCYFNVLLTQDASLIFAIISSLCSLILFILAFCSIKLCGSLGGGLVEADAILGFGSILFAISHIFAIGLSAAGVFFSYK